MSKNYNITPEIIRTWDIAKLNKLAQDIRDRIIETVGKRGGHLAPSLGVVELTIALHYVFDTPKDKIVWDVGHQSYAHKLITGRWHEFETLRSAGGIAGFPKRKESEYDVFDTGHSGNSISIASGLATAAKLVNENYKAIAVIGDGSIVTGMAFEALNYTGAARENFIVILNDNEMSIGKSTGAMAKYLSRMITGRMYNRLKVDTWNLLGILPKDLSGKARIAARKLEEGLKNLVAPSVIFEEMGFRYIGPFDGHNLSSLIENFQKIKNMQGPILGHVVTQKGKGYEPAEKEPEMYHGIGPFAIKNTN
jgi:1-deoxy-D-xylulose-5-phosphate synthase